MNDTDVSTKSVSDSLRDLAAFLDAHPEIEINDQSITLLKYVTTREELAAIAKRGSYRKVYTKSYFELHHDFGCGIELHVYADRATVCQRVVTGTRVIAAIPAQPERVEEVVEWVCDDTPLLAVSS